MGEHYRIWTSAEEVCVSWEPDLSTTPTSLLDPKLKLNGRKLLDIPLYTGKQEALILIIVLDVQHTSKGLHHGLAIGTVRSHVLTAFLCLGDRDLRNQSKMTLSVIISQ